MGLSVFRSQNWRKSFRIGRNFCTAVSFFVLCFWLFEKSRVDFGLRFCDQKFFVELHDASSKNCVNANNSVSPLKGRDLAKIYSLDNQGVSHVLKLSYCLYVPDHLRNLLSVIALGQKGAKVVFDDTWQLCCSDKVSLPFVQRKGLYVTNIFFLQILLDCLKLILIFGIADWVTKLSAVFKVYQSQLKERNCRIQVSRSLFVTFVRQINWFVNLPVLRWLRESLRCWNWFIPMLGFQRKLLPGVDIGMLWASLTLAVASFVLIAWKIGQKSGKSFANFVLMKLYLKHFRLWRSGLMVEASMITNLLVSFFLGKELREKWLLRIPRIRLVLQSLVGKLLETWLVSFETS